MAFNTALSVFVPCSYITRVTRGARGVAHEAHDLEAAEVRAEQQAAFAARQHAGDDLLAVDAHVVAPVLAVQEVDAVEYGGGEAVEMTKHVAESRLAAQRPAQVETRCRPVGG